ncbi:Na+/H+ antiporter subunit C [Paracoccus aestuarii]|uniref:Na+/H+ antiporter subunit C n=1 Tax=Paracoccus aestuarii TaxID=453842 RepID=A0A419A1V5_9RHOB|nr:Na+/H+ antiporter subunit C [Paracoccus aestuarii]RJL06977.1 Na+/H+ antiporter subunit C [Paracoccus aestuarii]WCR00493.1 Na+/H+ antiporter subunit C [Paracoccus aestuarii]
MELLLSLTIGVLVATSTYLMLDRNVLRFLFGLVLLSNAVNLVIFAAGRLTAGAPPLIDAGEYAPTGVVANALPQALVLTAIVIGFGLLAFTLALVYRTFMTLGTVNSDEMRIAEPRDGRDEDTGRLGLGRANPDKPATGQEAGI